MRALCALLLCASGCSLLLDSGDGVCTRSSCVATADAGDPVDAMVVDASSQDGAVGSAINPAGVTSAQSGAASSTLSFPYEVTGPGQLMIVAAALRSSAQDFESVSYGFANFSRLTSVRGGDAYLELWYYANPPVGLDTVTLTASAERSLAGGVLTFTGVDLASPFGNGVQLSGDGQNSYVGEVLSETGELVVQLVAMYDSGTLGSLMLGGGFAEQFRVEHTDEALRVVGAIRTGAPSVAVSGTMTDNPDFGVIAVSLTPAP